MTTQSLQPENRSTLRQLLSRPQVVGVALVAYVVLALLLVVSLDRRQLLFPLFQTLVFPPLVLAPFLIMGATLDGRVKVIMILGLLLLVIPLIGMYDSSYLELVIQICIFAGLALGLNIVVGFAGLLDLGYIAFFAVGAYLWAMFTSTAPTIFNLNGLLVPSWMFYLFIIFGVFVAAICGILLGLPVLRLRGDYLAIVTLGFGEMIRILARNFDRPTNFTNGSQGLDGVGRPPVPEFIPDLVRRVESALGLSLANVTPLSQQLLFYVIAIIIVVVIILVARRLENSPIGRAWTAIREDEVAAIAMGVPLVRMKLLAFATGASFAGAIGVLYAAKQTFVSPESFSLIQSISILAMVIVGGIGGIRGALFGACVVTVLNLQVLKNISLQINAWKNIDAVLPSPLPMILLLLLAGVILFFTLRRFQQWSKKLEGWIWRALPLLLAGLLILVAFSVGDFKLRDWPNQLEVAKYERLIFGVLLIVMMIFRPAGLIPEPRRRMELLAAKEEESGLPLDDDAVAPTGADSEKEQGG